MRALAALGLSALAACASARGGAARDPGSLEVRAGDARLRLEYLPEDASAAAQVAAVAAPALARARRWGELTAPVTVVLQPTHAALEAATHRPGRPWLRAWARFDRIDLQSPRTWWPLGAGREEVEEVLAHELTHCVTYQTAGSRFSWASLDLPLWFREGMAASGGAAKSRRLSLEQLAEAYRAAPVRLPAGGGGPLPVEEPGSRAEADLAYGTAQLAFDFLVERYGDERVRGVLAGVREGRPFAEAFRAAVGIGSEELAAEFVRYVAWGGWAGKPR